MFKKLFKPSESLVSIDIGAGHIKLVELDTSHDQPRVKSVGMVPLTGDIFFNNVISKTDQVSEKITKLLETNEVLDKRVVTAVPGPSVFTKKVKMPKMEMAELGNSITYEAGNFIPHNIDAVKLDFHVVGESGKNQLDVLIVAVKNEIIDSFVNCFTQSGLDVAIVDVDYFALQNLFEVSYPEYYKQTVALINMGARYSSINICKGGQSLFTGDIAVGGKLFTDALAQALNVPAQEAENIKKDSKHGGREAEVRDVIDKQVEYVASEFNRQLSFFWNASGAEEGLDAIFLTGGSSLVPGLLQELSEKTGIECHTLDALKGLTCGSDVDEAYLREVSPLLTIALGMGLRRPRDKVVPDFM